MRRWPRRTVRRRAFALLVLGAIACVPAPARRPARTTVTANGDVVPSPRGTRARHASLRMVRIALARAVTSVRLSADSEWGLHDASGALVLGPFAAGAEWIVEPEDGLLGARRESSASGGGRFSSLTARPLGAGGTMDFNGRRWRGDITVSVDAGGRLLVVNRLPMDLYLRGVVPLEIGTRAMTDIAAAEAQAVAARSYAYMHLVGSARPYDMLATVNDQVYGGASAETPLGNQAVETTGGLVLMYDGRVVNAPYHGNCGGVTAEPGDAWRSGPEPYLSRVSDQIPGTDRFYCEAGPKFRWTRSYSGDELRASIVRYLRSQPRGSESSGQVRGLAVTEVTPAGRVATLTVDMDAGRWTMRGNEIRSALRAASGELLNSTYFSLDVVQGSGGVQRVDLRGGGNGHGVGMCQSGAMGRARAGQDFQTILTTYYPGTTIGTID